MYFNNKTRLYEPSYLQVAAACDSGDVGQLEKLLGLTNNLVTRLSTLVWGAVDSRAVINQVLLLVVHGMGQEGRGLKDLEMIRFMLSTPSTLEKVDMNTKRQVLKWAVEKGHLDVVEDFHRRPLFSEDLVNNACALLSMAINSGCRDMVEKLLKVPVVFAYAMTKGDYILRLAVRNSYDAYHSEEVHADEVERRWQLVDKLLNMPHVIVMAGKSAAINELLVCAVVCGRLDFVQKLLDEPVVQRSIGNGRDMMQAALRHGQVRLVMDFLIRRSDAVGLEDVSSLICPRFLLTHFNYTFSDFLTDAVRGKCWGILELVLNHADAAEVVTVHDNLALRQAARCNKIDIVKRLLGFDEVAKTAAAKNNEAFNNAARHGNSDIVGMLISLPVVLEGVLPSPPTTTEVAHGPGLCTEPDAADLKPHGTYSP